MDEGADTGDIVSQKLIIIKNDNSTSLYGKIIKTAKPQIIQIIKNIIRGKIKILKNKKIGNTWRKRSYVDGQIDWRMSADSIINLMKSLSFPYPGSHFIHKKKEYKLIDAKLISLNKYINIEPGKILYIDKLNRPVIKCGKNAIKIYKINPMLKLKKDDYI